jgi:hypothetical protein
MAVMWPGMVMLVYISRRSTITIVIVLDVLLPQRDGIRSLP